MKKPVFAIIAVLLFVSLACSLFTATASPPESQAPDAPAQNGNRPPADKVLFHENFSDQNSGWPEEITDGGQAFYQDDAYHILVEQPSLDLWAYPDWDVPDDVRIEVDATKAGGPDDNDFGVICRHTASDTNDNFYFLLISSDGFAVIGMKKDGSTQYLSSEKMQPSDAINQGAATNRIRADCIGGRLVLFVNGQQVASVVDSSLPGGDIGLIAGTFDVPNVDIAFDNLVVSRP